MTLTATHTLDRHDCEQFDRDGFLLLRRFYPDTLLTEFQQTMAQTIAALLRQAGCPDSILVFDDGIAALEAVDHDYVASVYDAVAQSPAFLRLVAYAPTTEAINILLQRDHTAPLYCFSNRCRIDPPHDTRRTYGWHQEVFYTLPEARFLQTWAPLIRPTTQQNGTLEVRQGSHREGIAKQVWTDVPGRATQIIVDEAVVDRYPHRVLDMALGDLVIFSSRTFHRSGQNTSNEVRYSLVGMYHDVDSPMFRPPKVTSDCRGESPQAYYQRIQQ